jgi:hypothetical protein
MPRDATVAASARMFGRTRRDQLVSGALYLALLMGSGGGGGAGTDCTPEGIQTQ